MIPGFSKAILRNIRKVEEDTRRLDEDSNDETEPEQESPTSENGAKGQKRKLSNVCEQLGKKKRGECLKKPTCQSQAVQAAAQNHFLIQEPTV